MRFDYIPSHHEQFAAAAAAAAVIYTTPCLVGAAFIHDLLVVLTTKAELQQLLLPADGTAKGLTRLLQDMDAQQSSSAREVRQT
jgi:hypothetical protein